MSEIYSRFETELQVRPDDIDMNQHVHSSRYMDYVLAARYDQMERCYHMPMETFIKHGFGWVIRNTFMEFKRPLFLGDRMRVATHIAEIHKDGVRVHFDILRADNGKTACSGYFNYTMVDLKTGRATPIPEWIKEKNSV